MTVYLVRHAKAGDRGAWTTDDRDRPLTKKGRRQAEALAAVLADAAFERIVSSPYVRCVETVVPLARSRRVDVVESEALTEGAGLYEALAVVEEHAARGAVLCSHGDVIPMLLDYYVSRGLRLGQDVLWQKGSTWVLDTDGTTVVSARYLPPPPD